jgi:hypothetical protein
MICTQNMFAYPWFEYKYSAVKYKYIASKYKYLKFVLEY